MVSPGGRVVLDDRHAGDPPVPEELQVALREWAVVAARTARTGGAEDLAAVRWRGRMLASRLAGVLDRPVDLVDPVTGAVERIQSRGAIPPPVGPTPWGTGLAVSGFVAVLMAVLDLVLMRTIATSFGLLWVPANLLLTLGLAPLLWMLRHTPLWRWPALGAAAGIGAGWLVLLAALLG